MRKPLGKISKESDGFKVRFERILNHNTTKVWEAITDPRQLKYWFTDIEMDFKPGGKMTIQFRDEAKTISHAEIVSIEPPRRFVWKWEGELAVFELTEIDPQKCRLILTYSKLSDDFAINAPAGFHSLLDRLEERLGGSEKLHPFGTEVNDSEHIQMKLRYAASVYPEYPEVVKEKPVAVERVYHAPIKKVWEALTDKKELKEWYFDLSDFVPEEGFEFTFPGQGHKGAQYLHLCKITEIIPFRKLQYSWQYKGFQGYSLVTFELSEEGENTKLRLTHFGLDSFPDEADFARESFNQGWNEIIGNMLRKFVEERS